MTTIRRVPYKLCVSKDHPIQEDRKRGLKERKVQEERKIGEKKNGALAKEPEARMVETTTEEVKFIKAELISAREFRDH